MKQADVEEWFGDRGIPLKSGRKNYRVVNQKERSWIFIGNKYQSTFDANDDLYFVELYCLNSNCAEVYNDWEEKDFDWSWHNLSLLLPQENDT